MTSDLPASMSFPFKNEENEVSRKLDVWAREETYLLEVGLLGVGFHGGTGLYVAVSECTTSLEIGRVRPKGRVYG